MIMFSTVKKCLSLAIAFVMLCASINFARIPVAHADSSIVYLPFVVRDYPWKSPFAVQTSAGVIANPLIQARAAALGAKFLRQDAVTWREVQPIQGAAYDWSTATRFENDLKGAAAAGMQVSAVVLHWPSWASVDSTNDCTAIRTDRFAAFAAFMTALVNRYKVAPYNVHYWELGNEIDVDPELVEKNNGFGCWGKISDPYYGGEHYGEMLKAVAPAIRAADPQAVIMIGGLLLDNPNTTKAGRGKPEKFLEGILRAGAANSFDIVAFHIYPRYDQVRKDYDRQAGVWTSLGGWTTGKTNYLRNILNSFGVKKTLWLNESGLICKLIPDTDICDVQIGDFFQTQADVLIRMYARGMNLELANISWYTLEGPGWQDGGLLDGSGNPRPAYLAYQTMISQTTNSELPPPAITAYGADTEAYRFKRGNLAIDLVWSLDLTPDVVTLPAANFIAAYNMFGAPVSGTLSGGNMQLSVGFSGLYIHRSP